MFSFSCSPQWILRLHATLSLPLTCRWARPQLTSQADAKVTFVPSHSVGCSKGNTSFLQSVGLFDSVNIKEGLYPSLSLVEPNRPVHLGVDHSVPERPNRPDSTGWDPGQIYVGFLSSLYSMFFSYITPFSRKRLSGEGLFHSGPSSSLLWWSERFFRSRWVYTVSAAPVMVIIQCAFLFKVWRQLGRNYSSQALDNYNEWEYEMIPWGLVKLLMRFQNKY